MNEYLKEKEVMLSIVIPVYNVEEYLTECLNSIRAIKNNNVEILIVNDGSTDNSYEIIKRIAKEDKRVTVYCNSNHGLSYTRNFGLKKARGEYILFVDSDDYLNTNMLEQLIEVVPGYDIAFFGYSRVKENEIKKIETRTVETTILTLNDLSERLEVDSFINDFGFAWNKIYRKSIIDNNGIKYEENTCAREDLVFNLQFFQHVDNVLYIENEIYYYVQRCNTLSRKGHELTEIEDFINKIDSIVSKQSIYKESMINRIIFSVIQNYIENTIFANKVSIKKKNEMFANIKKYKCYIEGINDKHLFYKVYKHCFKKGKVNWAYYYYILSNYKNKLKS